MKNIKDKLPIILVYLSKVINSGLSFVITYIITIKLVSPEIFGMYSFVITIATYLALFIGFGFNDALMNILINTVDKKKIKQICGLGYLMNLGFGWIYSIVFFIVMLFINDINVNLIIILAAQGLILNDFLNRVAVALKKTYMIATNLLLINSTVVILFLFMDSKSYVLYLSIYFSCYLIYTHILFLFTIKPQFENINENFKSVWIKVKQYGFNVYIGRVSSMGTYDMDKLMLKGYAPIQFVGYYNLGLSFTNIITMFSDAIMSVKMRDLGKKDRISRKILTINFLWLLIVSMIFATVGKIIFLYIFGEKYIEVANNFKLFAILAFFRGLFIPFNYFFAVKGYGKYLRNTAFILTGSNIFFNILLIPKYQLQGAIYATIISLIIDNIAYYYYYNKSIKKQLKGESLN